MSDTISRRDFLKLLGAGTAATAVLTGCGPVSRYVVRKPYVSMPEYSYNGESTYFATTCRECPAGCGLVVRTMQGRAIKVEGNKNNPVNLGKTCARGQATLQGLYNPDRVQYPVKQGRRATTLSTERMTWDSAVEVVADALRSAPAAKIAFLLGLAPDHLYDLVSDIAEAFGTRPPVRFGALSMFEARATLRDVTQEVFGRDEPLYFDVAGADVVFSFGANFLETWLSPVAYTRGFSAMRRGKAGRRGYLVQFEPRMSQTAAAADEWIPVRPGMEGMVALALGRLVAEARGERIPAAYRDVDVESVAQAADLPTKTLTRLAQLFAAAERPLAIPGGATLAHSNGLDAGKAVLALDVLAGNVGKEGGVFFSPPTPLGAHHASASPAGVQEFIRAMQDGEIEVLFVHGVNPVFELPQRLGFAEALQKVPLVISFASFPDETALQSDYIFPDHTALESWGYQRVLTGTGRAVLSGAQPVVAPYYDTRATVDVLLAAAKQVGGRLADALPFDDEVAYLQHRLLDLVEADGGFFQAPEINTFFAQFQQYGGWWTREDALKAPSSSDVLSRALKVDGPQYQGEGEFLLYPFVSPVLGEAGANKPWLQETPDPTTTVMWGTWVEMNPRTAEELGIQDDDVVRITSEFGTIEAPVYRYPAIRPDVIAVPFGQGHAAYGRYAQGRGVNPADLFGAMFNESGDLEFAALKVRVEKTGGRRKLSRLEGRLGVYGLEEK